MAIHLSKLSNCVLFVCKRWGGIGVVPFRHKGHQRLKQPSIAKEKMFKPQFKKSKIIMEIDRDKVFEGRVAEDNVWLHKYYPFPRHSLSVALDMHREVLGPDMMDQQNALVILNCTLDTRLKKKTKFMAPFSDTILLPHLFSVDAVEIRKRVFAISSYNEQQMKSSAAGASICGGPELLKKLAKGDITLDDFDILVCTPEVINDVLSYRKHLRDNLPSTRKGTLGQDLELLTKRFICGLTYKSSRLTDETGSLVFHIGPLTFTNQQLTENFDAFLQEISRKRSPELGPFVTNIIVTVPPSSEKLHLNKSLNVPSVILQQIEEEVEEEEENQVEAIA